MGVGRAGAHKCVLVCMLASIQVCVYGVVLREECVTCKGTPLRAQLGPHIRGPPSAALLLGPPLLRLSFGPPSAAPLLRPPF